MLSDAVRAMLMKSALRPSGLEGLGGAYMEVDVDALMEATVALCDVNAARYLWLEKHAKEVWVDPKRACSDICPDLRTKWELPVLICSGPVGGTVSFGEAIDIARGEQDGKV